MKIASISRDGLVLTIGFVLILLVIASTLLRSSTSKKNEDVIDDVLIAEESPYTYINVNTLYQNILNGQKMFLVDLREPADFERDHIAGSQNIAPTLLSAYGKDLDISERIILIGYAQDDRLEKLAADIMKKNAITKYAILEGGYSAWKSMNFQTVTFGDPTQFIDQSKVSYILPNDVLTLMNSNNNNITLLDVRDEQSYRIDHIEGSINIPLKDLEKRRNGITQTRDIIIFGATPLESFRGGSKLFDLSIYKVKTLQGSYKDLSQ